MAGAASMDDGNGDALVSTRWLAEHLEDADLRLVHAAGGGVTRRGAAHAGVRVTDDSRADFALHHIPGAALVDLDALRDRASALPNMLPSATRFGAAVGALGIGNGDRIVIYDLHGVRVAPRLWWMFRVFGHARVAVLDGGLPKWRAEGRPVAVGAPSHAPRTFVAGFRRELVRDLPDMVEIQRSRVEQVIDGRPPGRYHGVDPEPRAGIPSGHMPWSVNVPVERIVDSASGTLLPTAALRTSFARAGVEIERPAVATCGWGIAACTLALGLYLLGRKSVAVYDGSWVEWAARGDVEIVSGG
jgi:thiosulfate/3-mercaptopyruvate sulfurtransferase